MAVQRRDDDISCAPLTENEIRNLRRIMRDEDRMRWFWATVRLWVGWGALAMGGIYATYKAVAEFLTVKLR